MKRMTAEQMKHMPRGTLFAYGGDEGSNELAHPYDQVMIYFGDMTQHSTGSWEWYEAPLTHIECDGSDDMSDKIYDMMKAGTSYPIESDPCFGRHGMYPDNPIFFVMEPTDLLSLRAIVDEAIGLAVSTMSNHEKMEFVAKGGPA